MNAISDTSDDAEQFQLTLLRQRTPTQRVEMALRLSAELMLASKQAILRAHPGLTPMQVNLKFIELHYGRELAEAVRNHVENARHVPSE